MSEQSKKTPVKEVFACQVCGNCCRGEGGIFINYRQAEILARFLGLPVDDFIERYTNPRHGLLDIKTDADGFCLFHDRQKHICGVHEVKPDMCRDWPFFHGMLAEPEGFKIAKFNCPGILPEATFEDFKKYHAEKIRCRPPVSYLISLTRPEEDDG